MNISKSIKNWWYKNTTPVDEYGIHVRCRCGCSLLQHKTDEGLSVATSASMVMVQCPRCEKVLGFYPTYP